MGIDNIKGLWIYIVVIVLTLPGCSNDMSDLEQYIAQIKQKHVGEVEPLPETRSYQAFTYDASLLNDPFAAVVEVPSGSLSNQRRRKEPLESFSLGSLKMVGVLQRGNTVWGLVQDPEGTIHRIQVGNYIGKNDGKIIGITETQVNINEPIPDGQGGWINQAVYLSLEAQ